MNHETAATTESTHAGAAIPSRAKILAVFPQFWVADVRFTAEWYRDRLGFEIGEYFLDPPVFVHIRRDNVVLQLGRAHEAGAVTRRAGGLGCNAYLWTDQVDALAEELRSLGVKILEGPIDRQYACREIMVEDCNGLKLCYAQRT